MHLKKALKQYESQTRLRADNHPVIKNICTINSILILCLYFFLEIFIGM